MHALYRTSTSTAIQDFRTPANSKPQATKNIHNYIPVANFQYNKDHQYPKSHDQTTNQFLNKNFKPTSFP
jgi:hypothetical protein